MKKLVLIASLAAATAFALTIYRKGVEIQASTRAPVQVDNPTSSEYINLDGIKKIRMSVCSCSSSTCATSPDPGPSSTSHNGYLLSGNMEIFYYSPVTGTWMENLALKTAVGTQDGGCAVYPDISSPGGNVSGMRMAAACNGCTTVLSDGGNYFKVILEGITNE